MTAVAGHLYPEQSERDAIGVTVASRKGARLAAGRLRPTDFFNPRHQNLFEAAVALPEVLTGIDEESLAERVQMVAAVADDEIAYITALVSERSVQYDSAGGVARRVLEASRRRRAMAAAARIHTALSEGTRLEHLVGDIAEMTEVAA